MKILLITDHHLPLGGAENYFFELKNRLTEIPGIKAYSLGFAPHPQQGADFLILKATKSKILTLIWRIFFNPFVYFKIRRYIKNLQPDVIHLHNVKQYTTSLLFALKGQTVVQTIHDYNMVCPVGYNIHKNNLPCETGFNLSCFWQHHVKFNIFIYLAMIISFYLTRHHLKKRVKFFFAPSPLLVDYLEKNHFKKSIHIPPFKPTIKKTTQEVMRQGFFLFVGSLSKHKGINLLMDEFVLALKKNKTLILKIVGKGPEEHVLSKIIKDNKLEKNIFLCGWQQNLMPFYQETSALIFPSTCLESFGLVMLDAMSYSRAIIGINRGTSKWLIDEKNTGLLFDPLKKGDLAEKCIMLADDINYANKLGSNAHQQFQQFDENNKTLEKIMTYYQQCAASSPNRLRS